MTPCATVLTLAIALVLAVLAVVVACLPALRWLCAVALAAIVARLIAHLSDRKDRP